MTTTMHKGATKAGEWDALWAAYIDALRGTSARQIVERWKALVAFNLTNEFPPFDCVP